jgi:GNAT superfamily N-acetyltransferase
VTESDTPDLRQSRPPLVVRRASISDLPALLDFITQTYGSGASFKDDARLAWQFEDNPFRPVEDTDPTIWLAFDGPRVVGEIAVQDGMLWLESAPVPAGWIVDVMVHPDYRGQGLSHRIHAAIMLERTVLVTLTMAPATRRVAERAGCLTLEPTRQYILPHRLSAQTVMRFLAHKAGAGSALRKGAIRLFNMSLLPPMMLAGTSRLFGTWRQWRAPKGLPAGLDIVEVVSFPESIDALWAANKDRFPAVFERSARFLNWRFSEAPGLAYRRFLLHRDGVLAGYVVTRVGIKEELPLGVIADAFASPQDPEALDALFAHATQILRPDVEYIEAAASTPTWREALLRAGFIATKTMRPTVVCTDPALRDRLAQSLDGWHFTKADHDWDQVHPV